MKSFAISEFWKAYSALSPEAKEQAQKAYQLWRENSLHPFLHFKQVGKNLWSVRISGNYRALALKKVTIIIGFGLVLMRNMKLY